MPQFISDGGKWRPAQEKAVNIKTGDVYSGPDREASKAIDRAGGRMGQAANEDPENIVRARQLGMSVEDYLKLGAPPEAVVTAAEKKKKSLVVDNNKGKAAPKQTAVKPQGGGKTIDGGFGEQPAI